MRASSSQRRPARRSGGNGGGMAATARAGTPMHASFGGGQRSSLAATAPAAGERERGRAFGTPAKSKFVQGLQKHLSFSKLDTLDGGSPGHTSSAVLPPSALNSSGRSKSPTRRPQSAGPPPGVLNQWRESRNRENAWVTPQPHPNAAQTNGRTKVSPLRQSLKSRSSSPGRSVGFSAGEAASAAGGPPSAAPAAKPGKGTGPGPGGLRGKKRAGRKRRSSLVAVSASDKAVAQLRLRLLQCLAATEDAVTEDDNDDDEQDGDSDGDSNNEDGSGDDSKKEARPEVDDHPNLDALHDKVKPDDPHVPHLDLIVQVLKRFSKLSHKLQTQGAKQQQLEARLEEQRMVHDQTQRELNNARRLLVSRKDPENRVVVIDQPVVAHGSSGVSSEADALIRSLQAELEEQRELHEEELDAYEDELTQLRAAAGESLDLQNLSEELERLRRTKEALQRDHRQMNALIAETEQQKESSIAIAAKLEADLEEQRVQQAQLRKEWESAQRRMTTRKDQLEAVVARLRGMNAPDAVPSPARPASAKGGKGKAKSAKAELEELRAELEALDSERAGLSAENSKLSKQVTRLHADCEKWMEKASEAESQVADVKDHANMEREALQARLSELDQQMTVRIQEAASQVQQEFEGQVAELTRRLEQLEQTNTALSSKNHSLQQAVDKAREQLEEATAETARVEVQLTAAKARAAEHEAVVQALRQSEAEAVAKAEHADSHFRLQKDRAKALLQQVRDMEKVMAQQQQDAARAHKMLQENAAELQQQIEMAQYERDSAVQGRNQSKQEAGLVRSKLADKDAKLAKLRASKTALEAEAQELREQLKEAQEQLNARSQLAERQTQASLYAGQQVMQLRDEIAHLGRVIQSEKDAATQAKTDSAAAEAEAKRLKKLLDSSTATVVELRHRVDALVAQSKATGHLHKELGELKHRAAVARAEGIKEGKSSGLQSVMTLTSQLAEIRNAYEGLKGEQTGAAPSTPTMTPRQPLASPSPRHAKSKSSGLLEGGARQMMLNARLSSVNRRDEQVGVREADIARQELKLKEQRAFLNKWANDLAEQDRIVTSKMHDMQQAAARVAKQRLDMEASQTADKYTGAELEAEREAIRQEKLHMRHASEIMRKRLALQMELLTLTPKLSGNRGKQSQREWKATQARAVSLQQELDTTHAQLMEVQSKLHLT